MFGTLLITLLTLSAFAALAWYARRRGWLNRWMSPAAIAGDATRKLAVVEVLRVSSKTTIYRVRDGDRELILTESQAQIHVIPATTEVDQ